MIKGVIFDADGTLLDSMKFWDETVIHLIKSMGVAPSDELTEILTPMSMEEGAEYIKKAYALSASVKEIIEEENRIVREFYSEKVAARKGTAELLKYLKKKNIPITVASATDRDLIESALESLGIYDCFQAVLSCTDIGEGKASPKIYYAACEIMRTDPGETLVAEDSLTALTTAGNAGFVTMGVYDETQKRNWEAIKKISDFVVEGSFDINIFSEII